MILGRKLSDEERQSLVAEVLDPGTDNDRLNGIYALSEESNKLEDAEQASVIALETELTDLGQAALAHLLTNPNTPDHVVEKIADIASKLPPIKD